MNYDFKSNVETIDFDAPTPKLQKLTNKLTEKNGCLRQKYGNLTLKTGRVYKSRWRCFREHGCYNFKTNEPLPPTKKLSHIKRYVIFEIELSDYKQQQSHPMNEHFWYHRILSLHHKLLMLNFIFQLTHMIVIQRRIQN